MLKYGPIEFDDWVPASETSGDSAWAYVCEKHLDQVLAKCPDIFYDGASTKGAICGVYKCHEDAFYEIDFLEEEQICMTN